MANSDHNGYSDAQIACTQTARPGMVVAGFPEAARAGARALAQGGNAVDAACAAAWALAVCEPAESGLGGQAVMLIWRPNDGASIIDGHSRASRHVTRRTVSRHQQQQGHRATTIPTVPMVLGVAQRMHGRLTLAQVLEPAIEIAQNGYRISTLQRNLLRWCCDALRKSPEAAAIFLRKGSHPYHAGDVFRQPVLARTLAKLASGGVEEFYTGEIARTIVQDMESHDGLIDAADLSDVQVNTQTTPLESKYRALAVVSVPPPGGGVNVLLALNILQQMSQMDTADAGLWRLRIAQAVRAVFIERDRWHDHPDDFTPSLARWIASPAHAQRLAGQIDAGEGLWGAGMKRQTPASETTHLCAVDDQGQIVALTQSIQSVFGAKVVCGEAGFLYNNYLKTCPRSPHPYRLGPRCSPRSNAAPTLVLRPVSPTPTADALERPNQWRPMLALGAAGSRRITSSLVQVISAVVDRGLPLDQAIALPRVHALLSGKVWVEHDDTNDEVVQFLHGLFKNVRTLPAMSYKAGAVNGIWFDQAGVPCGGADPRRDGVVATV